jgi:PKD repeat protein
MKKIFQTVIFLLMTNLAFSQCGNTDFELGNFTGWAAKTGRCCPIVLPNNGFAPTRQTIMTQGTDPRTCGGLRTVYQGTYSAKLGNQNIGAQAEGLYYTFVVTPTTTIIRYAYAVVFQDPNHLPNEQPRFQSRVRLSNGSVIPCTDYSVTAASNLPGFRYCFTNTFNTDGDSVFVAWRDWTEVAVDLSSYVGQTVTLEFETGDCLLTGHYGYAYIDAVECGQSTNHVTYCENDTTLTLNALGGFASYEWQTGDTTQSVTINPQLYDTITCVVTTFLGCQLTLYYILDMAPGFPNFTYTPNCAGLVQFTNMSTASYSPINYLWTFPNGSTSTEQNPSTILPPGIQSVNLYISSNLGCGRDTTIVIEVYPTPFPNFISTNVCLGNLTIFTNLSSQTPGYPVSYLWEFGDNTTSNTVSPSHIYTNTGTYLVTLSAATTGTGCVGVVSGQITVHPLPTISNIIIN